MPKSKDPGNYDIYEHLHRFAAWAASTAASQQSCRFPVEIGERIIKAAKLKKILYAPERLPTNAIDMDAQHKKWRKSVRAAAKRRGLDMSHGVAAKLINVYLKAGLVMVANCDKARVCALHPPIDRQLLKCLKESDRDSKLRGDQERAIFWRSKERPGAGWTSFGSRDYQKVIEKIRDKLGKEKRLWMIEEHWIGHQG
jgi:hypothetical protein